MSDEPAPAGAWEELAVFRETGEERALLRAWSSASNALAESGDEADLADRFETAGEMALAIFGYIGNFSWLDGAIEMLRRSAAIRGVPPDAGRMWKIQHVEWGKAVVQRSLADAEWTILHPDGRVSHILGKDWSGWQGTGWPTGWTIRRPDGTLLPLAEDHFGDGWTLIPRGVW